MKILPENEWIIEVGFADEEELKLHWVKVNISETTGRYRMTYFSDGDHCMEIEFEFSNLLKTKHLFSSLYDKWEFSHGRSVKVWVHENEIRIKKVWVQCEEVYECGRQQ